MKRVIALLCVCSFLVSFAVVGSAAGLLGDADGDGKITSADARIVLRVSVNLEDPGEFRDNMDVDGDDRIAAADARLVLRRSVGLETSFPAETILKKPTETASLPVYVSAPRALLYEVEGNRILYQKNIDAPTAPASLIKLLTALTALKYCSTDQIFTVGNEIDLIASDSSVCGLKKGWRMSLEQMLYGMLLPSGNDAAFCIAANTARSVTNVSDAGTAIQVFLALMNQMGQELGMTNTWIKSPDGYDAAGQYTTTRDLLTLTRAALRSRLLVEICSRYQATLTASDGSFLTWKSTNRFLNPADMFYDARVYGMKGGFTDDAGVCLIALCRQNEKNYIAIVMGLDSFTARYDCAAALFNAAAAY